MQHTHGFSVPFRFPVLFTQDACNPANTMFFDVVRREVAPGSVKSKLLVHPLAEDAGGDFFHNGGKHFSSQNDPEWQTLKAWVLGQTAKEPTR